MRPRLRRPGLRQLVQATDQALEVGAREAVEREERLDETSEPLLGVLVVVAPPALGDVQRGGVRGEIPAKGKQPARDDVHVGQQLDRAASRVDLHPVAARLALAVLAPLDGRDGHEAPVAVDRDRRQRQLLGQHQQQASTEQLGDVRRLQPTAERVRVLPAGDEGVAAVVEIHVLLRPRLDLVQVVDQVDDRDRALAQVLLESLPEIRAVPVACDPVPAEELAHPVEAQREQEREQRLLRVGQRHRDRRHRNSG